MYSRIELPRQLSVQEITGFITLRLIEIVFYDKYRM